MLYIEKNIGMIFILSIKHYCLHKLLSGANDDHPEAQNA